MQAASSERPTFGALLSQLHAQLQQQHDRELAELRSEIARLKSALEAQAEDAPRAEDKGASEQPMFEASCQSNDIVPIACGEGKPPGSMATTVTMDSKNKSQLALMLTEQHQRQEEVSSEPAGNCRDRMKKFANKRMETIVSMLIVLNVIFDYVRLEVDGMKAASVLGLRPESDTTAIELAFFIVSHLFTCLFAVELLFKLFVFRREFYYKDGKLLRFNIFDTLVVLLTVVDMWILSPLASNANLTMIRLLRLIRTARALRIARTSEVFEKLRILVATVIASFSALFWSIVLLSVVMLMASLMLCQALSDTANDVDLDDDTKSFVYRFYGTPTRALWTVFEFTFSGGWPNYARTLVEDVNAGYAIFFAMYIMGVVFAMFRIITALFLRDTLAVAAADFESRITESRKAKAAYAEKLIAFFEAADTSGDGFVSWEEFEEMLADETMKTYLETLELDADETTQLFDMLDDGDRKISAKEFVDGALRLKGQARAADVISIMRDCNRVLARMGRLETMCGTMLTSLRSWEDPRPI